MNGPLPTSVVAHDVPSATRLPRLLPTSGRENLTAHVARFGALPPAARAPSRGRHTQARSNVRSQTRAQTRAQARSNVRSQTRAQIRTRVRDEDAIGGEGLIKSVELAGLVGRGGAGFPTAQKLRAVAEAVGRGRGSALVVVNAMEGEPTSAKDRVLLQLAPHLVLDGAALVADAVGAAEVVVCIPRTDDTVRWAGADSPGDRTGSGPDLDNPGSDLEVAARSVAAAIEERGSSEWDSVPMTIARPPERFISGESSALARWLGGGPALPAFSRVRLAERGVNGVPTLLDNAETLAHIALIARYGAGWFRALGTEADPGTALVTVSGAVARPGVAEVPLGATLGDLIAAAGGPSEPLQAVLLGGYGGTWVPIGEALGLPIVHRASEGRPSIGPGIVVALPAEACGLAETARVARYMAGEGAGQCGPCVYGLPALAGAVEALARPVSPATASTAVEQIGRWGAQIEGRGACHHPDGVVRFVRSAMDAFRDDVLQHAAGMPCAHRGRTPVLPVPGERRARDGSRL
jgi:NADH:ubiquinone oxidoreductase subunit F (NADH-binding)